MGRQPGLTRRLLFALALAAPVLAADPPVPPYQGYVTDLAGVIPAASRQRITQTVEDLKRQTGAEIAVLTVPTTEPLDDFTYAMRVADAWKVGAKGEDTGVIIVLATEDRKLRILTGYGVEGMLPDGLVGRIQDRDILPAFREGRIGEGLERGVATIAKRIIDGRQGIPPPADDEVVEIPGWVVLLLLLLLFLLFIWLSNSAGRGPGGSSYYRRYPGGFGGGSGRGGGFPIGFPPGGFGGGGHGGFEGFGGGSFGGGGAGRSW